MQIKKFLTLGVISAAMLASTVSMAGPHHPHRKAAVKLKKMHAKKMHKKIAIAKYKKRHGK